MSRILQLRRGTTAENDNFTGLNGEITFDTQAHTLRVHDGQTLGGYALARADQVPNCENNEQSNFNANNVPDEFWQNLFARFAPPSLTISTSEEVRVENTDYIETIFDTDALPYFTQALLVCDTPEAGYSVGDKIATFGIDNRANPAPMAFFDENGLKVRLPVGGKNFWVLHKIRGQVVNITNENWGIIFRIYC